jgi:5'-methylthioadenosine phosphorylase
MQNARTAQGAIADAVSRLPVERTCACGTALAHALITRPDAIPAHLIKDLAPIVGKYLR